MLTTSSGRLHYDPLGMLPREQVIGRVKEAERSKSKSQRAVDQYEEILNWNTEDIWKWKTGQGY